MTYTKGTKRTPEEIDNRLREAAQRHKFGVLNVQDLRATLRSKGIELGSECRMYDVCNPQAATKALRNDMRTSAVLPCRISVFMDGTGTKIATVRPTDLLRATGITGVEDLANEIEREVVAMIDEAA